MVFWELFFRLFNSHKITRSFRHEGDVVFFCVPVRIATRRCFDPYARALGEGMLDNTSHTIRDDDVGQAGASPKRLSPNVGHTICNGDGGQAGAVGERPISNIRHTV